MFARLVNLVLDAQHRGNGEVTGADAVRAHRCAYVLRHLIEGTGDGSVAACVGEEYPAEMNYVMTRPEVMSVTEAGGDEFFRRHVKPHWILSWPSVSRTCCRVRGTNREKRRRG